MTNFMDSILEFQSKLNAELAQTINEPASLTLSAQEMIDLVKTISSLHQYVKSIDEKSQLVRQDNQLLKEDVKSVKKNNQLLRKENQLLRQDVDFTQKNLQKINRRDLLNSILLKQPQLVEKHEKLRLAFVPGEQHKEHVTSFSVFLVHEANVLAHDISVENVYGSLNDPEIFTAIFEVLQIRLAENANLESLFQNDLMILVAGVPKLLIQQAFGRFLFFFFD